MLPHDHFYLVPFVAISCLVAFAGRFMPVAGIIDSHAIGGYNDSRAKTA